MTDSQQNTVEPKKRGGRKPGSKNRPKDPNAELERLKAELAECQEDLSRMRAEAAKQEVEDHQPVIGVIADEHGLYFDNRPAPPFPFVRLSVDTADGTVFHPAVHEAICKLDEISRTHISAMDSESRLMTRIKQFQRTAAEIAERLRAAL